MSANAYIIAKEDGGSIETITSLEEGKVIPFFGNKEYWQIPANEWSNFLHPANHMPDDSGTVWSIVK